MSYLRTQFRLFLLFTMVLNGAYAASVDTVMTYSTAMKMEIKAVVIKPDGYASKNRYPVIYLLHGYSGKYSDWVTKVPALKNLVDQYQFLIVCPDGGYGSWYVDSPELPGSRYETYISGELVRYMDSHFGTEAARTGRAITGLSMGGHGALLLAMKHQDVFGACGSMSGGLDLRPFPKQFGLNEVLGEYSKYPDRWEQNSVINLTHLLTPGSLAILVDCGAQDFFYGVNLNFHNKLAERNIPHDFTIRPGGHTWDYWANSIGYQALFFSKYFAKSKN